MTEDMDAIAEASARDVPLSTWLRRHWVSAKCKGELALGAAKGIAALFVALWIGTALVMVLLHQGSIEIETIGVPEALAKAGFTSQVATERLRGAILAIQERAETDMAKGMVDTGEDLAAVIIPKSDFSMEGISNFLRHALPGWGSEITGEFTQSGRAIALHLRLNGRTIYADEAARADPNAASAMLGRGVAGGARAVLESVQPYIVASALYGDGRADVGQAETVADDIIARLPEEFSPMRRTGPRRNGSSSAASRCSPPSRSRT